MGRLIIQDRLSVTIARALFRGAPMDRTDRYLVQDVYDAVVDLAKAEREMRGGDRAQAQVDLAWRTLRRQQPEIANSRRTLAGAILALCREIAGLKNDVRQAETAFHEANARNERLINDEIEQGREVEALKARVAELERQVEKYERPGFSTILKMIRKRQAAAVEQYDTETANKLEVLWQAVDCVLLPSPNKATPRIEFSWPEIPPRSYAEFLNRHAYFGLTRRRRETGPPE